VSGPHTPREGPAEASSAAESEGGGLASALAATRARLPRGAERRRRTRTTRIAVGAAAVALVLLAALLVGALYGLRLSGPGGSGSTPPNATTGVPSSFYGSLPAANALARASYWDWPLNGQPPLVFAEGLASPSALSAIVNGSRLGTVPCGPTLLSTTIPTLPPYPGALSAGLAPAWLFAFNPSGFTLMVLAVVNGTASLVATTVTDGACYNGPGSFNAVAVDSGVAAAAAAATLRSKTFFQDAGANGTAVSAEYLLVPPGYVAGSPLAPMWVVNDTTCALYGGPAVLGTALSSVVNAATGSLYSQKLTTVTC
jgi:hypothetical protein